MLKVIAAPEPLNAVLTVIGAVRLVVTALNATVSLVVVMLLAV